MLFCPKCSVELDDNDSFCSNCGYKLKKKDKEARTTKVINTLDELVTKSAKGDLSKSNKIMKITIFLLVLALLFMILSVNGAMDDIFRGSGLGFLDPCHRELKECYKNCEEGLGQWGGVIEELCNDTCTWKYLECRE